MSKLWQRLLLIIGVAVAVLCVYVISGCSSGGGGLFGIDQNNEIQIGRQAAADLEHQYGVVNDPVQTPRIERIGTRIAAVTQRPDLPWSFKILNMSDVNALSLPGGFVYVTKGLLQTGLSDAELAGVIGHEAAHVNQRHVVKAIQRNEQYQLLAQVALGGSSASVQQLANLTIQLALELPHSRQDEYEADAIGTRFAYNADYPANGLLVFLGRLNQIAGSGGGPAWLSTHPSTPDRIAREQQLVAEISTQRRPVPVELTQREQKILKDLAPKEDRKPATPAMGTKGTMDTPAPPITK